MIFFARSIILNYPKLCFCLHFCNLRFCKCSKSGAPQRVKPYEFCDQCCYHNTMQHEEIGKIGVDQITPAYYTCHTSMESCACQQNFDTKMSGLASNPREYGILLTVSKNPGPQPDTASYLSLESLLKRVSLHGHIGDNSQSAY